MQLATAWRALALLFICAGALAAQQPERGGAGTVSGTVTDSASRQPISGAMVSLVGTNRSTETNAAGRFRLDDVSPGAQELLIREVGYHPLRVTAVQVKAGEVTSLSPRMVPAPVQLEQLQVTATKDALSVGEAPVQIDVVRGEQIQQKGDTKLTQAIQNVPGLLNSALEGAFESVQLRGMPRTGNEWTTTLLLIDGIPQADSRNSARVINLPINDAQNIEVVRGPNSALYGRQAIGGTVNVLTADPTPEPRVRLEGQLGEFDYRKAQASASGPIDDWGGYLLSWGTQQDHGYFAQNYTMNNNLNSIYGKFRFIPGAHSSGMISFNNVVSNSGVPSNLPVVGGLPLSELEPVNRFMNLNIPTSSYHQEELRATLNYTYTFTDDVDLTEVFGYRKIQYKFIDDGDVIGSPFDTTGNTFTMYPFDQQTDERIFYQELRLGLRPQLGPLDNSILIGASYEHNDGFSGGNLIYTDPETFGWPVDYLNPSIPDRSLWQFERFGGQDYRLAILGLYVQDIIRPTSSLLLTLGGRYDRLYLRNTRTLLPGSPSFEDNFDAFSPKVGVTLKLLDARETGGLGKVSFNLYGNFGKAFLTPRVPGSLSSTTTAEKLQPEDITNWEGGFKASLLDGRVGVDASYYRTSRDGIVVEVRQGPFYNQTNAGEQRFRGLEVGLRVAPRPTLSLYVNGAFSHSRFGDFVIQQSSGDIDLTGNRLPIAPDRIFNAGLTWQAPHGYGFTVNVKHVGEAALDQGNTFNMPAYTMTDASIFWTLRDLRFTLGAHNLLNEKYFSMGDVFNGESLDPGAPRQIVFSTAVDLP
jgi:iron complex outermembrane receptor protein